jgi:hypothetical protein
MFQYIISYGRCQALISFYHLLISNTGQCLVSVFPVISYQLNLTTDSRYDIINKSELVGQANIRQYSSDPEGLKQAIEDRTIEDVIQLVNSQIRIVESGKVRSGQDPMKRAEDALKGLSSDQRSGLMERLMTEAGA